jgi:type II pantothenate kinase
MKPEEGNDVGSATLGKARVGVDCGASLVKVAVRGPTGTEYRVWPASGPERVAEALVELAPGAVAMTGGGSAALAALLPGEVLQVGEFEAWAAGARSLLADAGQEAGGPLVVVSVGTGTSAVLAHEDRVERIGGTALGGGTLLGLGSLLADAADFEQITELAARGDRHRVDLLVSEIYEQVSGNFTAASFGKPALRAGERPSPEDLCHAVTWLVGENVALIVAAHAAARDVKRIAFGGSTLHENPALREVIDWMSRIVGREPVFLEPAEYVGAVGCLEQLTP